MSLYQEVRLYTNASQREAFDNRAELYSIIKTIQELEVNCPEFINWVGFGPILERYSDFLFRKRISKMPYQQKLIQKLVQNY